MVDACMRSLNETGWINFRMRALLVSFASYDLWLDWRWTARHLAQAFIDYEASPVTGSVALLVGWRQPG